jgi:hypothetical protein
MTSAVLEYDTRDPAARALLVELVAKEQRNVDVWRSCVFCGRGANRDRIAKAQAVIAKYMALLDEGERDD